MFGLEKIIESLPEDFKATHNIKDRNSYSFIIDCDGDSKFKVLFCVRSSPDKKKGVTTGVLVGNISRFNYDINEYEAGELCFTSKDCKDVDECLDFVKNNIEVPRSLPLLADILEKCSGQVISSKYIPTPGHKGFVAFVGHPLANNVYEVRDLDDGSFEMTQYCFRGAAAFPVNIGNYKKSEGYESLTTRTVEYKEVLDGIRNDSIALLGEEARIEKEYTDSIRPLIDESVRRFKESDLVSDAAFSEEDNEIIVEFNDEDVESVYLSCDYEYIEGYNPYLSGYNRECIQWNYRHEMSSPFDGPSSEILKLVDDCFVKVCIDKSPFKGSDSIDER